MVLPRTATVAPASRLGAAVPASLRHARVHQRLGRQAPGLRILAGDADGVAQPGLRRPDAGRRVDHPSLLALERLAGHRLHPGVEVVVVEPAAGDLRDAGPDREQREQRRDGERHLDHGGRAAPLAASEAPEPDLDAARDAAYTAQQGVEAALAADGRAGGVQRFAQRQPRGTPHRRQRGERRTDEAEQRARDHDGDGHREPGVHAEEHAREQLHEPVGQQDAQRGSDHRSERAEQEGRPQVDPADVTPARADRLHRGDLAGLLADQRGHRVRDEHERGDQRQEGEHVEEARDVLEALLAGIGPGLSDLREVREAGE